MSVHKTEHLVSCGPRFLAGWQLAVCATRPCTSSSLKRPLTQNISAWFLTNAFSAPIISDGKFLLRYGTEHKMDRNLAQVWKDQGRVLHQPKGCARCRWGQLEIYSGQGHRRHAAAKTKSNRENIAVVSVICRHKGRRSAFVCVPCINFVRWMRLEAKWDRASRSVMRLFNYSKHPQCNFLLFTRIQQHSKTSNSVENSAVSLAWLWLINETYSQNQKQKMYFIF